MTPQRFMSCMLLNTFRESCNLLSDSSSSAFKKSVGEFSVAQQVQDTVLLLQWLGSLLWCRFDPWPRNFHRLCLQPKKKKKKVQTMLSKSLPYQWALHNLPSASFPASVQLLSHLLNTLHILPFFLFLKITKFNPTSKSCGCWFCYLFSRYTHGWSLLIPMALSIKGKGIFWSPYLS